MRSSVHAVLGACGIAIASVVAAACGSSDEAAPGRVNGAFDASDAPATPPDAADAADAAAPREEVATGRRIVSHPATLAGLTADGYVVFTDVNEAGHSVAKVVAADGTGETTLATSSGIGKSDLRFEIRGRVVFVWADRGNRVGTLTLWSKASGVVVKGPGARPGRAAASADGAAVAYMRDVTTTTASIVAGPIAGDHAVVGAINAQDDTCWRDVDLAAAGDATARILARYCPSGSSAFTLRSIVPDGSQSLDLSASAEEGTYGKTRVVWRETSGALRSAAPDGTGAVTLATDAADYRVARDETLVVFRTAAGAILSVAADGTSAPVTVVAAPDGKELGALSNDNQRLLFASRTEDRGTASIALYTDVKLASLGDGGGPPTTLVAGTTSCASCVYDSFTPDGTFVLLLDPIDNSQKAAGVGTLRVFGVADGASKSSFDPLTYTALALGKGSGASSRFLFVDAAPDALLVTGFAYGLATRALGASDPATTVARGVEQLVIDANRANVFFSFATTGPHPGIWVAPLP